MADSPLPTRLVPGFDFLQGLVKNAGAALPSIGQWIAPTLNPEELEKRIEELRTVQFWLEQNARMLGATIQALEVQRMTLSTLKTMNVQMEDLRESLRIKTPPRASSGLAAGLSAVENGGDANRASPPPESAAAPKRRGKAAGKASSQAAANPMADPVQWWGALTKQFTQLAAATMKDSATDAAKTLATSMVKQSFDAAGETLKQAAGIPARAVRKMKPAASSPASGSSRPRAEASRSAPKATRRRSP